MPAPLRLPPGVRAARRTTPDGIPHYEFHHDGVGLLGSVIVRPDRASGKSQMDAMLAPGGPGDPLDGRRRDLLGQVVGALGGAIDERYGPAPDRTPSMPPPDIRDAAVVGHHLGRCPRCGALKYHLVFAPGAESAGDLETQVRRVHAKIVEIGLPTWAVGADMDTRYPDGFAAPVRKVWPERGAVRRLTPDGLQTENVPRTGSDWDSALTVVTGNSLNYTRSDGPG